MGKLILSRDVGQAVYIGPDVVVTVVSIDPRGAVRLAFEAPANCEIDREEIRRDKTAHGRRRPDPIHRAMLAP